MTKTSISPLHQRMIDDMTVRGFTPSTQRGYQNKAMIYAILFKAAAETLITIAADPKHLGDRTGLSDPDQGQGSIQQIQTNSTS
ncbi:MAG: hypothetical protein ISR45_09225 [Rhodospirillales bacterium]|nr:hypothetical protein [Rhodospirillales bacterium]